MRYIIITLLIMLFIGMIPVSCCSDENSCDDCGGGGNGNVSQKFNIQSLGISSSVDTAEYADYKKAFKSIYITRIETAYNEVKTNMNLFTQSAFACSPPDRKMEQNFFRIKILSVNTISIMGTDFVTEGEDITDKFIVDSSSSSDTTEIQNYIDSKVASGLYESDALAFRLKEKPDGPIVLKFDIMVTLTDGRFFTFENQTLKLL